MTISTEFSIGLGSSGSSGMVTLASLKIPDPKPVPQLGMQEIQLFDGSYRMGGYPMTSWKYGYLTPTQRDALRVFCPSPGISSNVYICSRSLDNSNAFHIYQAIMHWPAGAGGEDLDFKYRMNFVLEFRNLVLIS